MQHPEAAGAEWAEIHLRSLPPCQLSCAMLVTAASMTAKETEWLSDFAAPVAAMPRKPASNRGQHQLPTAAQRMQGVIQGMRRSTPVVCTECHFLIPNDKGMGRSQSGVQADDTPSHTDADVCEHRLAVQADSNNA